MNLAPIKSCWSIQVVELLGKNGVGETEDQTQVSRFLVQYANHHTTSHLLLPDRLLFLLILVLNANMIIVLYVAHYWARKSIFSITKTIRNPRTKFCWSEGSNQNWLEKSSPANRGFSYAVRLQDALKLCSCLLLLT